MLGAMNCTQHLMRPSSSLVYQEDFQQIETLRGGWLDLYRRDRTWTADNESDNIDEKSSYGQYTEKQRFREGNSKESIQGVDSRSYYPDCYTHSQQQQRKLQAALTVPEAVFPVALENRHEHSTEDPCSS